MWALGRLFGGKTSILAAAQLLLSCAFFFAPALVSASSLDVHEAEKYLKQLYEDRVTAGASSGVRVEDFLDYVEREAPEYFYNYSLVYRSNSLQQASLLAPRAVLFGKDARFTFTFNGNPEQRGYSEVEVAQYYEQTNSFNFYTLGFHDGRPTLVQPAKCLNCHGNDAQPIWRDYPVWFGVYGSQGDNLSAKLPDGKTEREHYEQFLKSVDGGSRYRYLKSQGIEASCGNEVAPFVIGDFKSHINCRPNFRYATLLSYYDAKLTHRRIQSFPDYETRKYILAYLGLGGFSSSSLFSNIKGFPGRCAESDSMLLGQIRGHIETLFGKIESPTANESANLFLAASGLKFSSFMFFVAKPQDGNLRFNWLSNQHVYLTPIYNELRQSDPELRDKFITFKPDHLDQETHAIFTPMEGDRSEVASALDGILSVGAFEDSACEILGRRLAEKLSTDKSPAPLLDAR